MVDDAAAVGERIVVAVAEHRGRPALAPRLHAERAVTLVRLAELLDRLRGGVPRSVFPASASSMATSGSALSRNASIAGDDVGGFACSFGAAGAA